MFQFGFLSANMVYMAFIAVYLVSFGFFSISKLDIGKLSAGDIKQLAVSETVYQYPDENNTPGSFHYSDYYSEDKLLIKKPYSLSFAAVPIYHEKVPDPQLSPSLLSRPPPSVK